MTITRHLLRDETDLPRIFDLISRVPLPGRHVLDLPWRLSSPAINEGRDAAFWENADGEIVGFAAWQYYWATLDFFILPGPDAQRVETDLFTWAEERFRERDEERGYPLPYWVEIRDDDQERRQLAETHGFVLEENNGYIILQHTLATLVPIPALPDGFSLRCLAGEQETTAYSDLHRAAFASDSMTPAWRTRTLRMPLYRSDLDLVVSAPDGSLAGFCVGWFAPSRRIAQIEPIGVHPAFQRLGLGRALLAEMLQRLKAHGAESVIIEPFASNLPIQHTCATVGFVPTHTIQKKGKWLEQPA